MCVSVSVLIVMPLFVCLCDCISFAVFCLFVRCVGFRFVVLLVLVCGFVLLLCFVCCVRVYFFCFEVLSCCSICLMCFVLFVFVV